MSLLTLASGSARRARLLERAGYGFDVVVPDVDEVPLPKELPAATAVRLARAKAAAVGERALILAADTLVVVGETPLGKPGDAATAIAMLRRLRGRSHTVVTGCVLRERDRETSGVTVTRVWMRDVADSVIEAYVAGGEPLDKAGGYAIQERGGALVAAVSGSWSNVVGLPLAWTVAALTRAGLPPS